MEFYQTPIGLTWNANVLRRIRMTERVRLELRGDFINIQNRSQMNPPDLNPTSTNFGRITSQTSSFRLMALCYAVENP